MPAGRLEGLSVGADLYETDFIGWTEQQARLLRAAAAQRTNLALDWDHLAEEVEDLGKSYRRALASQIGLVIEHLLKLQFSPASGPRPGWLETIDRARDEIESWLATEPGLRPRVPAMIAEETPRAARRAARSLQRHGEDSADIAAHAPGGGYTEEQILGDWLPPSP
jgi:hypothetical protein